MLSQGPLQLVVVGRQELAVAHLQVHHVVPLAGAHTPPGVRHVTCTPLQGRQDSGK